MHFRDYLESDVFDIIRQTTYMVETARVAIEDAGDEFLTSEEMTELGLRDGTTIRKVAITAAVEEWIAKIPEGKKSIKCTDTDLIEVLANGNSHRPTSLYVDGIRRIGNRFIVHRPQDDKRVIKSGDVNCLLRIINSVIGCPTVQIRLDGTLLKKLEAFSILQKLVTWDQIEKQNMDQNTSYYAIEDDVLPLLKEIWEDDKKLEEFMDSKRK